MADTLARFLAPDSIAIVGASNDPTKRGYKALKGLLDDGYAGHIYPINPKSSEVLGVPAYASLLDLPAAADLALICTPAKSVPSILQQCGRNGVHGAVVLASGFGEVDATGAELERQLLYAAQQAGVRVVGPNTSGMFNLHKKVNLLALDNVQAGDIGIISQSGNILLALALEAERNGHIGFSTYVGPGNQTDVGFADYLNYLGEDEHTKVATFYVEGFKQGRAFLDAAKHTAQHKPIVVYKSGSTEAGKKAASSHTGSLAGSYSMTVDLLRQSGVNLVAHSDEILPVAEGLALLQQAQGKKVAVLADGGGQATIATDRLFEAGLELADLSATTQQALADILFPQASLVNPVDVAGSTDANPILLADCMRILAADEEVDMVLLVGMFGGYAIRFAEQLAAAELATAEAMVHLAEEIHKPLVIYSLYAHAQAAPLACLRQSRLPVYDSIEHAVQTMAALAQRGLYIEQHDSSPPKALLPKDSVNRLITHVQKVQRHLYEYEARDILRAYGVTMERDLFLRSKSDVADAVQKFGEHTPLAMKVVSKDILHKSDAGGVRLNVTGANDMCQAYDSIMHSCLAYKANADIEGVLLMPMAGKGTEVIIGMSRDEVFGPVLMFGLGGIFVEILKDVAFRAIPIQPADAASMIEQIKGTKVLDGARGNEAVDKHALVDLLVNVSAIVAAHPEIAELDLNPVIAHGDGCTIADARIILTEPTHETTT